MKKITSTTTSRKTAAIKETSKPAKTFPSENINRKIGINNTKPSSSFTTKIPQNRECSETIFNYLENPQQTGRGRRKKQSISDDAILKESPKRRKVHNATLAKIRKNIKDNSNYDTSTTTLNIPNSLEDLSSDDDNNINSLLLNTTAAHKIDGFLESDQLKRIQMENELRIKFECPLYKNIGSLNQVFRLQTIEQFGDLSSGTFSALELMFISSPNSKLRSMFIENVTLKAHSQGLQVSFHQFFSLLSYIFQIEPIKLCTAFHASDTDKVNTSLKQITTTFGHLRVDHDKDRLTIQNENICLLLDYWPYLRFFQWSNHQLVSLFCALSHICLDSEITDIRYRVANAFQMILRQILDADPTRKTLDAVIYEYISSNLLNIAERNIFYLLVLFTQFIQSKGYFDMKHVLAAANKILISVSGTYQDAEDKVELNLGNTLLLLPKTVNNLKKRELVTDLYLVYNQLVDELTIDQELLTVQHDQSLIIALDNYRKACRFLNKRDINDKMIDTWSRSMHRIKEVLQNRKNSRELELRLSNTNSSNAFSSDEDIKNNDE